MNSEPPTQVVLVVEDHVRVRQVLSAAIEQRLTATVLQAGSIADALAVLGDRTVDAILLDVNLPHVSGLDALPQVRARAPGSRIVLMSAGAGAGAVAAALAAGADAFVDKSESLDNLCSALTGPPPADRAPAG